MTTKLIVSCNHVHPDYRLSKFTFDIRRDGDKFYATAPKWGCGKSCETARGAVLYLLRNNACFDIRFHDEEPANG